ncbi:MAG TPA: hypothetical protein VEG26_12170 [Steroidobacteraceae bacterium]|nr:hypothetical protein [Steroidobacteraceae bacterium]
MTENVLAGGCLCGAVRYQIEGAVRNPCFCRRDRRDVATLDDPAAVAPLMHVWVKERLPWVAICDSLPQHSAGSTGT